MTQLTYMVAGQEGATYKETFTFTELYHISITQQDTPTKKPRGGRVKANMG